MKNLTLLIFMMPTLAFSMRPDHLTSSLTGLKMRLDDLKDQLSGAPKVSIKAPGKFQQPPPLGTPYKEPAELDSRNKKEKIQDAVEKLFQHYSKIKNTFYSQQSDSIKKKLIQNELRKINKTNYPEEVHKIFEKQWRMKMDTLP